MKRTNRRRHQQGGFVLIVALAMLVLITIVATMAYQRASDQHLVSGALRRQSAAQDRAMIGLQRGVAEVNQSPRPAWLSTLATAPACPFSDPMACGIAPYAIPPLVVDNSVAGIDIDMGGGSQYTIDAWRWQPPGATEALIIVHSVGFHGNNPMVIAGATRMSSEVIVEVSEGQPNKGGCTGYCGAGLD